MTLMKRITFIAIGVVVALALIPTVVAVAQADPAEPAACAYHQAMAAEEMACPTDGQQMMTQNGMGMMSQNGMGMMGQNGMDPENCPMRDDVRG